MQKTLLFLLIGLLVVGGIVAAIAVASGGLDSRTKALAQTEIKEFDTAGARLKKTTAEVQAALKAEAAFFGAYAPSKEWPAALEKLEADLAAAWKHRDVIDTLVAKDDSDDRGRIDELVGKMREARRGVSARSSRIADTCRKLLEFKKQSAAKARQIEADYQAIQAVRPVELKAKVDKAMVDWPAKKPDLTRRMAYIGAQTKQAVEAYQGSAALREQAAKGGMPADKVVGLFEVSRNMQSARAGITGAAGQLPGLIEQLYWSWEKILVDMDIREGLDVSFHHKLKTVKTRVVSQEAEEVKPQESSAWQKVTKARFESMKNSLGMVVEEKPAGKYNLESTRVTQPPGYSYIASRHVGRNHYGYWHHGTTGWYWHWHRPYGYMGRYYWGPSYRPISSSDYGQYRAHRTASKPYTAAGRYGSTGTATRSKYSASKYVSTGGFRTTNYVKSGGTYRGSRYARTSRSTGSSSSRSRSGSYRSSSYRSSGSRSGGGK